MSLKVQISCEDAIGLKHLSKLAQTGEQASTTRLFPHSHAKQGPCQRAEQT